MSEAIRFEDYEVVQREDGAPTELGRGTMGITYKAWDTVLHREVALKVINQSLLSSLEDRDRFLQEASDAKQLQHPNIASIYHLGHTENNDLFCAMEFCDGPSLEQVVQAHGPFTAHEAMCIAGQVSLALIAAEERGWRHGDLKPTNLILTESATEGNVVKLIDFGLARSFHAGRQTLAILGSYDLAGTAYYASPEQLEEMENLDIRSDIYSLGACLWFALTGRPPIEGPVALAMSRTLLAELPWDKLAAQPAPVVALLKKMLARKPEDRPASAAVLCAEIEKCLQVDNKPLVQAEFATLSEKKAPVPEKAAAPEKTSVLPLPLRFQPVEEIDNDATGRLFRAIQHDDKQTPVWFRQINPVLNKVAATRQKLQAQITAAKEHPHTHFVNIITAETTKEGTAVIQEYIKGFSLFKLIQTHEKLAPEEVMVILEQLAQATDHAAKWKVPGFCLDKKHVFVHFPDSPADEAFGLILDQPLKDWPPHEIKADVISLSDTDSMLPGIARETKGWGIAALATLTCELLGGRRGQTFIPIPQLGDYTNQILRSGCTVQGAFPSAQAFAETLGKSLEAKAPASKPRPSSSKTPAPNPKIESKTIAPSKRRQARPKMALSGWLIIAALVAIVVGDGIGGYYYFYIYQPRERDRQQLAEDAATQDNVLKESPPAPEQAAKTADTSDLDTTKHEEPLAPPPDTTSPPAATSPSSATAPPAVTPPSSATVSPAVTSSPATAPPPTTAPAPVEAVTSDDAEAAAYRVKASAGDVETARKLGLLYYNGQGVPKDPAQALKWLQQASDQGDAEAQTALGTMYFNGWGVPKDYDLALRWHQKAADQGNSEAMVHLGAMYAAGWGVTRDYTQAFNLIQKSANQGNADGEASLGAMYQSGLGVAQDYEVALGWFQKAADQGNTMGETELGVLYAEGRGVQKDYAEALICFEKAADQGDTGAQVNIGDMYKNGWGVPKDEDQALQWYQKAAAAGDPGAQAAIQKLRDASATIQDAASNK